MERRSIPHIIQLSLDAWPSDPHDGALVIGVVLELLKREPMPSRIGILPSDMSSSDVVKTLDMIRAATTTIFKPFLTNFHLRRLGEDSIPALRSIEGNVSTLIRWLDFMGRESPWIFDRWSSPKNHTNGPMLAAQCLQSIYTAKLRAEIEECPQTWDLLLYFWSWAGPSGRTLHYHFLEGPKETCPVLTMLCDMLEKVTTSVSLAEKVQAFSKSQYLRFIGSALDRLEEWAILRLEPQPVVVMRLLQLMQAPLDLPEYAAWYARCEFSPKILCVAKKLPHLRARGKYGRQLLPLPVAVATYLFPLEMFSVILSYRSLPELLSAGLLEILIDYLLSLPEGTAYPWYPWAGEYAKHHLGEPISIMLTMCVYPPILEAVCNAKLRVPKEKLDRLNKAQYHDQWSVYLPTLSLYERIWQAQDAHGPLAACDNLNVSSTRLPLLQ